MKSKPTLRQTLISSHVLVSHIPLALIGLFIVLLSISHAKKDFSERIDILSQGIRGQIQITLNQPLTTLRTIGSMLQTLEDAGEETFTNILGTFIEESPQFESIQLLNSNGDVAAVGVSSELQDYKKDLIGINLGHKKEFQAVLATKQPQWSDTFLSLTSGKISLTLYLPVVDNVLAADINIDQLAKFIHSLSSGTVTTIIIDRNGAILFHPDRELIGKGFTANNIELVTSALSGNEGIGQFSLQGETYLGATSILSPIGWIALIAEPIDTFYSYLTVPLLIIGCVFLVALCFSLSLAFYRSKRLSLPLTQITAQSSIIAKGDYSTALAPSDFHELQQLSDSINQMAEAIQNRENELREKELKYREVVENTSNLIIRLDRFLTISYVNETINKLTVIPSHETTGKHLKTIIHDDDWLDLSRLLEKLISSRTDSEEAECRIVSPRGEESLLLLSMNLHYDSQKELTEINIIGHDITTRRQLEQQQKDEESRRLHSQKMELVGLMAGGVAHDFNNVLSGIIGASELLQNKMSKESNNERLLQIIIQSAERAADLTQKLLAFARKQPLASTAIDLHNTIQEALALLDKSIDKRIKISVSLEAENAKIVGDPTQLQSVIMNLGINASHAMTNGGKLSIVTDNIFLDESYCRASSFDLVQGEYLQLEIRDNGHGIAPDELPHIFEPFFTTKAQGEGTGLGLAASLGTIEQHRGAIHVYSEPGAGTVFHLFFPLSEGRILAAKQDFQPLQGFGTILLVDDEEFMRITTKNLLENLGYEVLLAENGKEALLEYYEHMEEIDLVLLDMIMPEMNGKDCFYELKKINPKVRALLSSGFSKEDDIIAMKKDGLQGFLHKPYRIAELSRELHRVLSPT